MNDEKVYERDNLAKFLKKLAKSIAGNKEKFSKETNDQLCNYISLSIDFFVQDYKTALSIRQHLITWKLVYGIAKNPKFTGLPEVINLYETFIEKLAASYESTKNNGIFDVLHFTLICIGDLYRYLITNNKDLSKDFLVKLFEKAEENYLNSGKLCPSNGKVYNQLAVLYQLKLSLLQEDGVEVLKCVYFYVRALCVKKKYPISRERFVSLLENYCFVGKFKEIINFIKKIYLKIDIDFIDITEVLDNLKPLLCSNEEVILLIILLVGLFDLHGLSAAQGGKKESNQIGQLLCNSLFEIFCLTSLNPDAKCLIIIWFLVYFGEISCWISNKMSAKGFPLKSTLHFMEDLLVMEQELYCNDSLKIVLKGFFPLDSNTSEFLDKNLRLVLIEKFGSKEVITALISKLKTEYISVNEKLKMEEKKILVKEEAITVINIMKNKKRSLSKSPVINESSSNISISRFTKFERKLNPDELKVLVFDTNIYVHVEVEFFERLLLSSLNSFLVVMPLIVLNELYSLINSGNEKFKHLKTLLKKLNELTLANKNFPIVVMTSSGTLLRSFENLFQSDFNDAYSNNDDLIISCCLELKKSPPMYNGKYYKTNCSGLLLITNDVNLRLKAHAHDVHSLAFEDFSRLKKF